MNTQQADKKIIIGRVGAVHGLKGWVKCHSFTQPLDNILSYQPWLLMLNRQWQPLTFDDYTVSPSQLLIHFPGIDNRDAASALTNAEIAVYRRQLPDADEGQYYWTDLENCEVFNQNGLSLGFVTRVMNAGANDILVVKGDKERLIPYILEQFISHVDLPKKQIHVVWDPDF